MEFTSILVMSRNKDYIEEPGVGEFNKLIITTPTFKGKIVDAAKWISDDQGSRIIYPKYGKWTAMRSYIGRNFPYRKRINKIFGDEDVLVVELNTISDFDEPPGDVTVGCTMTEDNDIWKIFGKEASDLGLYTDEYICPDSICHTASTAHANALKKGNTDSNFLSIHLNDLLVQEMDEQYLDEISELIFNSFNHWQDGDIPNEQNLCQLPVSRIKGAKRSSNPAKKSIIVTLDEKVKALDEDIKLYGGESESLLIDGEGINKVYYPENGYCFVKRPRVDPDDKRAPFGSVNPDEKEIICGDDIQWIKLSHSENERPFEQMGLITYMKDF